MKSIATPVVIVEDHELLAQSLRLALAAEGLSVEVARLADLDTLLADLASTRTGLVLLDLDLGPVGGDGLALIPPLVQRGVRVLVVSGVTDRARLASAIEAGALGFVSKTRSFDELLEVVMRAAAGQPVLSDNDRQELLAELRRARREQRERLSPFERLTPRERQVLAALGNGQSVEAIAHEWYVSEATVRTQVRGVLTKLEVCSQLAAVAKARQAGWLSPPV